MASRFATAGCLRVHYKYILKSEEHNDELAYSLTEEVTDWKLASHRPLLLTPSSIKEMLDLSLSVTSEYTVGKRSSNWNASQVKQEKNVVFSELKNWVTSLRRWRGVQRVNRLKFFVLFDKYLKIPVKLRLWRFVGVFWWCFVPFFFPLHRFFYALGYFATD